MCMFKPHYKLRSRVSSTQYSMQEVCDLTGINRSTMSQRLSGQQPFRIDEIYALCDVLEIPYSSIPEYFPPAGNNAWWKETGIRKNDEIKLKAI